MGLGELVQVSNDFKSAREFYTEALALYQHEENSYGIAFAAAELLRRQKPDRQGYDT